MFFFFVCGEHTFRKDVEGYEGMVCQCYNCGNMAGHVIKSHPWFTFCWIVCCPVPRLLLLFPSSRLTPWVVYFSTGILKESALLFATSPFCLLLRYLFFLLNIPAGIHFAI